MLLLAEFYLLESRYEEATATYQVLEQGLPDNHRILNNLAWSLKDSNPGKGLEYAQRADRIDPDNPFVMDTLAMLLMKIGENSKALEVIEQAISKAPNVFDIQLNYADILVVNNQTGRARKVLGEILQKTTDPDKRQLINKRLKNL